MLLALPASAQETGLSDNRLSRLDDYLNSRVQDGGLTGAVVVVARRGQTAFSRAYGHLDAQRRQPMPVNAVFDLGRLTEPVTAAAALIMQEQGQWLLADPIGRYLPEFAQSSLSVWDALRHTTGLTDSIPPLRFAPGEVVRHSDRLRLSVQAATRFTGQSFIRRLAEQPVRYQPGQVAERGFAYDVLGLALEKASNQTLGTFFLRNLFIPMDMWDTGFNPPAGMENRLVGAGSSAGARDPRNPVNFECGGACLTGTAEDYLRFATMLLNDGLVAEQRVLSRPSARRIVGRQLGADVQNRLDGLTESGAPGFDVGLGVSVVPAGQPTALAVQPGEFGVASPGGQLLWVSPAERLVIVLLAALPESDTYPDDARRRFQQQVIALVKQSIND